MEILKKIFLGMVIYQLITPCFASQHVCQRSLLGYNLVKHSIYPFYVDKDKACFFAFYTPNPELRDNKSGTGNLNLHAIWYGYYKIKTPSKIYEFPKPQDNFWSAPCHINAISFYDMDGDKNRDVSIIGSCNQLSKQKYTYPFVFIRKNKKFILNEDVYTNLYGFINLSINDLRNYIANPDKYYVILRNRYKSPTFVSNHN